ncbi:MAG TPA: hypothetical protein VIN61_17740 [Gammaproteobacteria bacterium]
MLQWLSDVLAATGLVNFVNGYSWVWPVCEICHFIGMGLLIGTVGLTDLRILGIGKGIPINQLERLIPLGVAGFLMNTISGFIFVAGNPVGGPMEYLTNLSFQLKMLLVLIAGINVFVFYFFGIARAADAVGAEGDAAGSAKAVAAVSLVAWFGVIFFGRMIMYNDTLLYTLGL